MEGNVVVPFIPSAPLEPVVPFEASIYAHQNILSALFLVLKDGVLRGVVSSEGAENVMHFASRSDCRIAKIMLEELLRKIR
jgi:hypothetical protein